MIGRKALERGGGQVRKVMAATTAQLDALGKRVEIHRRATLTPALSTRTYDDMDAPARSLAHLQVCAKSLRDTIVGGFSKGIKVAKIALENALEDYRVTVARTGEAARWMHGVADEWYEKGKEVCRDLLEESAGAIREAEEREGAETKIRLMESHCEELENLADQVEKQAVSETARAADRAGGGDGVQEGQLGESGTGSEGHHSGRIQGVCATVQDSAKIAREGKRRLGDLRARLEFRSFDSEAGSYRGPVGSAMKAGPESRPLSGAPERGRRSGEGSPPAATDLAALLRGWGQLRAKDSGWPTFDGQYASYPRVKREWVAYKETYHSIVNDDLAAKTLREKCVKGDAHKMVSHLDDLREIWDTLDTYYKRLEKYMEEALKPILEFRKYRVFDSGAVREFYSILRAAIKGARSIGRLDLLVNDQTVPKIMGKIPFADWREWATKRPEWIREDLGAAFERFVERKWKDALNVAAAEPQPWEPEGPKKEKATSNKTTGEKAAQGQKGAFKTVGAANVVTQQPAWGRRKCRVQEQTGCEGDHLVLRCGKLRKLSLCERRRALEASRLCMFCLRHPADAECFDQGGRTKPACVQPGCKGKHAVGVHELFGGADASVNLVAEEDHEEETRI